MASVNIPDGVRSFGRIVAKQHLYADKTGWVPALWALGDRLVLRRPPGFGKTLLLSMLAHYHDLQEAGSWQARFAGLAASGRGAGGTGEFLVLRLDFCGRRQASRVDELRGFAQHYEAQLGAVELPDDPQAALKTVLEAVQATGLPLCALVDGGDLRELPDWCGDLLVPAAARLLITGTHPCPSLAIPDVTTVPELAGVLGLISAEVDVMLDRLGAVPRSRLRKDIRHFYGGYRFAAGAPEVCQPAGVMHFLWSVYNRRLYPRAFWREPPPVPPTDPGLAARVVDGQGVDPAEPGVAPEVACGTLTLCSDDLGLVSPNWSQTRRWAARLGDVWLGEDLMDSAVAAVRGLTAGSVGNLADLLPQMPAAPLRRRLLAVLGQTGDYAWEFADARTVVLRGDPRESAPLVHWRLGLGLADPAARQDWWQPATEHQGATDGLSLQQAVLWENAAGNVELEYGPECAS